MSCEGLDHLIQEKLGQAPWLLSHGCPRADARQDGTQKRAWEMQFSANLQ